MYDLGITNGKVYINNSFEETNIYIKDGKISKVSPQHLECKNIYDVNGDLVFPGIIDPHTHFELNLGSLSSKDDFYYGTKAAAFGGVTTIIDFIEPVSNTVDLYTAYKNRIAQASKSVIDYKLHGCLKNPKNHVKELVEESIKLGLNTIKIFTTYSDSHRRTYDNEIIELLTLTKTKDFMLTVHIENDTLITLNDDFTYKDLLQSRPTISETTEAVKLASYTRKTGGKMYMVHLSSGETLQLLKEQYSDILNKNFIIESCPHYFTFDVSVLNQNDGYLYTMAPPLRTKKEKELLQNYIDDVYTIGTDHCPFNKEEKKQDFLTATPLGIGGIEYSFPVMYTMFGNRIIDKMTKNVAKAHKLYPQKGVIKEGSDADLFIYRLQPTKITASHGLSNYSVYTNIPVNGEIISTLSNGRFVVKNKVFTRQNGKLLNKAVSK